LESARGFVSWIFPRIIVYSGISWRKSVDVLML